MGIVVMLPITLIVQQFIPPLIAANVLELTQSIGDAVALTSLSLSGTAAAMVWLSMQIDPERRLLPTARIHAAVFRCTAFVRYTETNGRQTARFCKQARRNTVYERACCI